jgi:hypothetical protein
LGHFALPVSRRFEAPLHWEEGIAGALINRIGGGETMTTSAALAFFKTNGYVVIPNALTGEEVAFLNDWVGRDMVAHPGTFPLVREILDEEIRFGQFDFRDVAPGIENFPGQNLHGDRAFRVPGHPAGERPEYDPEHPYQCARGPAPALSASRPKRGSPASAPSTT